MTCNPSAAPAVPHLRNAEIDAHELLDDGQRLILKTFRNDRRSKRQPPITMLDFAQIALRANALDFAESGAYDALDVPEASEIITDEFVMANRALQRAAVLYVYEALQACDNALVRSELDPALRTLMVLVDNLP